MDALGYPCPLTIKRLERMRWLRLLTPAGVVGAWLLIGIADLILSVMMFFSDPNPEIMLVCSPMLLAVL